MAPGARTAAVRDTLTLYLRRRIVVVLLLGFSSGLPLLLSFSTLSTWMREVGIDLTAIGLFSLVGLPYTLKFAWAPIMDRLRSEEHTSELQSLMRISYAVFCLKK